MAEPPTEPGPWLARWKIADGNPPAGGPQPGPDLICVRVIKRRELVALVPGVAAPQPLDGFFWYAPVLAPSREQLAVLIAVRRWREAVQQLRQVRQPPPRSLEVAEREGQAAVLAAADRLEQAMV